MGLTPGAESMHFADVAHAISSKRGMTADILVATARPVVARFPHHDATIGLWLPG